MAGDPLGLERGVVRVVPWDSRWPRLFEVEAARLRDRLGGRILTIDHVGSTAVVGLAAKPIMDILVGVADLDAARALVPDLALLDFEFRPDEEIPDRHFFRRMAATIRTHHLSLAEPASRHYRRTIAFRDALRANSDLRLRYDTLKNRLAERYAADRDRYTEGKSGFVLEALESMGLATEREQAS